MGAAVLANEMKANPIVPVSRPRAFPVEDLFFSVTDRKGVITACNDVFVRIAGFASEELLAAPHNIIRHPDMPRCVFKLLWDEILAGRPLGAYVKNIAKTGEYYWVFALVLPMGEHFLSVRLKPTGQILPVVERTYAALLAEEAKHGKDWRAGMAAAGAMLPDGLASLGFASYQEFMTTALLHELEAREQALAAAGHPPPTAFPQEAGEMQELRAQLTSSERVADMGFDVSLLALNASIAAVKRGNTGRALAVVGRQIAEVARSIADEADQVTKVRAGLATALLDTAFRLGAHSLLTEMKQHFESGMEGETSPAEERRQCGATHAELIEMLDSVNQEAMDHCRDNMAALDENLTLFSNTNAALSRTAIHLELGQITGKTLSAAIPRGAHFASLVDQVSAVSSELRDELWQQQESVRKVEGLVSRWRRRHAA